MTVTLGINGFGRIGRTTLASIFEYGRNDVIVSKVNAPGSIETNAHLLRYDSVHGRFAGKVDVNQNSFDLGRGPIEVLSSYNADDLDWSGCDVVLECTGKFTSYDKAIAHVKNGAKSVQSQRQQKMWIEQLYLELTIIKFQEMIEFSQMDRVRQIVWPLLQRS